MYCSSSSLFTVHCNLRKYFFHIFFFIKVLHKLHALWAPFVIEITSLFMIRLHGPPPAIDSLNITFQSTNDSTGDTSHKPCTDLSQSKYELAFVLLISRKYLPVLVYQMNLQYISAQDENTFEAVVNSNHKPVCGFTISVCVFKKKLKLEGICFSTEGY